MLPLFAPPHIRKLARPRVILTTIIATTFVLLTGGIGYSQSAQCGSTLPAPLVTFCANTPAVAEDINANFGTIFSLASDNASDIAQNTTDIAQNAVEVADQGATIVHHEARLNNLRDNKLNRADLQFSGETSVQRNNSGGSNRRTLGSTTRRACFLVKVEFKDNEGGSENARCRVYTSGGTWYVEAVLGSTPDADAYCGARCLSW